jgi:3-deoxy-manno-octulosonate cytidylyltransferase (CMP-KDO synthetase)
LKVTALIPARFASERLPGKPLKLIGRKTMIQWTYEACDKHPDINQVIVLTDDKRIFDTVIGFGGEAMMTSKDAENGTKRIGEVYHKIDADIILNIQGDEPGLTQAKLSKLVDLIKKPDVSIATLAAPIYSAEMLFDYNKVKVVFDQINKALYFSRQAIPSVREEPFKNWLDHADFYLHLGLYGFKKDVFSDIITLESTEIEEVEKLEQLRWMFYGFSIHVAITDYSEITGVDTPEDLKRARKIYLQHYGK